MKTLIILLLVTIFFGSCASTCQYTNSHSYKMRNNCAAYR